MDYDSQTLVALKTMCKDRGLRVSGSKAEVVIRLIEDDESKSPQPISIQQPNVVQQQPVTHIIVNQNADLTLQITGIGIILYGFFRIGMALIFSDWRPDQSFMALLIGLGYLFGGTLTLQGYKQGLQLTLIVLAISGILSLIYHDDLSPLSIGMDGTWPIGFSVICSGTCMLIVAIPLLGPADASFKQGHPSYLNALLNTADLVSPLPLSTGTLTNQREPVDTKIVITCPQCSGSMKVPSNYKGSVRCPRCKEKVKIQ